jgi:site-specific recombinase
MFSSRVGSILRDTTGFVLFCETGLPSDRGFAGEAATRWARKWLPAPSDETDLSELLAHMFPKERDRAWLGSVSPELVSKLGDLIADPNGAHDPWRPVRDAMADAIALVATRISALGLASDIRARSPKVQLSDSPFFRLPRACDKLLSTLHEEEDAGDGPPNSLRFRSISDSCQKLDVDCRSVVAQVFDNLERTGVSVDVVYRLDLIQKSLARLEALLELMMLGASVSHCRAALQLLYELLESRQRDLSITQLMRANMQLLARKIIERAGQTGEHYITATRTEYWKMLASAGGGGILTAGTAGMKYVIGWAKLPFFVEGLLSSANYAGSFLLMQLCGFTLATKQPSMTAAALAGALRDRSDGRMDALVTQIARITRSQLAAALGNIGLVIPAAYGVDFIFHANTGRSFLDADTAAYVLHSLHPTHSGTIPYAAFTGVLLWMSSVAAGWLENWAVYQRLPEGIEHHPIRKLIGQRATNWLARAFSRNVSGFGGNTTLGVLLGMIPVMGKFMGLPLDVRHVTLSTGALVFAACSLGRSALREPDFIWACVGIAIIGMLNFGVSFVLAMMVALRARGAESGDRLRVIAAVIRRLFTSPLSFVFPPKGEVSSGHH